MPTNLKPKAAVQEGQPPFMNPLGGIQSKLTSFFTVAGRGDWRAHQAQLS